MKRFEFPLQRVLDVRGTQLAMAEARVKQQSAALADLDRQRADTHAAAISAENEIRANTTLSGSDLAALGAFRIRLKVRQQQIAMRRRECEQKLAALQTAMTEARQRVRLLERLKDKRQVEWKAAGDKELEELAADAFLAGWGRQSR